MCYKVIFRGILAIMVPILLAVSAAVQGQAQSQDFSKRDAHGIESKDNQQY
jgi:hypothetical protein